METIPKRLQTRIRHGGVNPLISDHIGWVINCMNWVYLFLVMEALGILRTLESGFFRKLEQTTSSANSTVEVQYCFLWWTCVIVGCFQSQWKSMNSYYYYYYYYIEYDEENNIVAECIIWLLVDLQVKHYRIEQKRESSLQRCNTNPTGMWTQSFVFANSTIHIMS